MDRIEKLTKPKIINKYYEVLAEKDNLARQYAQLYTERVAVLGEGECFVRKNSEGFVESVRTPVDLRYSNGEIYKIGERWGISADGYDKLNQAAGLRVEAPKTISILQPSNPFFEKDEDGKLMSVMVRRVVVGPSPIGNIVAIERVLRLDVEMYFIEDLQLKVKNRAGAGGYGTLTIKPDVLQNKTSVVMFPLGPAALWVDVSHVDIQDAFREHIKRCKYAERMAVRMCERNALGSHPAIAKRHVDPVAGVARVTVFGGKSIVDEGRIKGLLKAFEEGDFESGRKDDIEIIASSGVDEPELNEVLSVSEDTNEEQL